MQLVDRNTAVGIIRELAQAYVEAHGEPLTPLSPWVALPSSVAMQYLGDTFAYRQGVRTELNRMVCKPQSSPAYNEDIEDNREHRFGLGTGRTKDRHTLS
jgi:hypothetical protein